MATFMQVVELHGVAELPPATRALYDVHANTASFRHGVGVRRGRQSPRLRADDRRPSPQLRARRRARAGRADGARARAAGRRVPPALRPRRLPARRRGVSCTRIRARASACCCSARSASRRRARPTTTRPGEAWFETGPDPVHASTHADEPSAFVRCMVLPRALAGIAVHPLRARRGPRAPEVAALHGLPGRAGRAVTRSGGQLLADQLALHDVELAFCVPGESYLALLDGLYAHRDRLRVITCRHEAAAANAADAYGKLTGRPGVCMVTRGPGATHASTGVHTAMQDSTPLVLLVGQVPREHRGREAFQEIDYEQMFGRVAKWVFEIDRPERIPELVARAFATAVGGRPGPVVLALPEDVLVGDDRRARRGARAARGSRARAAGDLARMRELLAACRAPARDRRRQAAGRRRAPTTSARSCSPAASRRRPRSAARTSSTTACRSTAAISGSASTRRSRAGCARPTSCSRSARGSRRPRPAATPT